MTPEQIADSIAIGLQERHGKKLDPRFIYAHSYHETGGFSSALARDHHNYGGVTQIENNGLGQPDGSLSYKHFDSDEDYVDFMIDYYNLYDADGLFEATNTSEVAHALKSGGYYTDDEENYTAGLNNGLQHYGASNGNSVLDIIANASHSDSHGLPLAPVEQPTEEQEEPDFWDKLTTPVMESPLVKTLRVGLLQAENPATGADDYIFTKEDIDLVNKNFNGDVVSQNFIYSNANSHQQLIDLVNMQKESKEMERRLAESSYGVNTAGTFIGTLTAEALNPLNYIGLGLINKGSVAAKMLKSGILNAAVNTADASMRERLTGMKQDIATSAIIGAAVGAALPGIAHLATKGASREIREAAEQSQAELMRINTEAQAVLDGKPLTRDKVLKRISKMADTKYKPKLQKLQNLLETQKGFVVTKKKLPAISRLLGVDIPDNARAFNAGGTTVFIKEVVDTMDDAAFDKLLLHEVGVHSLPAELKAPILDFVKQKMNKPKGLWREALDRATAATPKGELIDPEEVLGYWTELRGDSPNGGFLSDLTERINKALGNTKMTTKEVLDIIRKNRDDLFVNKTAQEGGADIVKLSADGDVTENYVVRLGKEPKPHSEQWSISKWFEGGGLFGNIFATPYGRLRHSAIKAAREVGELLYSDARMRGESAHVTMSAEDYRQYVLEQLAVPLGKFQTAFRNYAFKHYGVNAYKADKVRELNKKIMLYHDYIFAKHSLPENMIEDDIEIRELARLLNDVEGKEIQLAKSMGYINDPNWENLDKGTRRVFDSEKWLQFISDYKGKDAIKNAEKDLADYFYRAGYLKIEENRMLLQRQIDAENADILYAHQKASKNKPGLLPPVLKEMSDEMLDDFIRSEANKAAKGYIDMNTSNFDAAVEGETAMPWMRHRMHMDTSMKAVINGKDFSFDENLRSYDLQHILNRTTNRWAGEIALHQVFQGKTTFKTLDEATKTLKGTIENYRMSILKEGEQRRLAGSVKQSEIDEALKTFDDGIRELRGLPPENANTTVAYAADILRNWTYARVGGNMALNQKMDFGNAIGYVGFKAFTSMIPYGRKKLQAAFIGKDVLKAADEMTTKLMGADLRELNGVNMTLLNSKRGAYFKHGSVLDTVNNVVNLQAEITNNITQLGNLTARMVRDARMFTLVDVMKALKGQKTFGLFNSRTPFSKEKLRAAGILDKELFFKELKRYQKKNGQLDIDKMFKKDPVLHSQLWKLVDNQAKRCVVEPTLGNKNILASSNAFWKILFQFKNFSFYATNSQTFRKLSNRDRDDIMSTIYEVLMAAGVTYIGVQGAAWAKYGNDEAKRQKYIDKRMENFYYGVATRSGTLSSPFAFGIDALDAMGYMQSFRTTAGSSRYNAGGTFPEKVGRFVAQSPAFETLSLLGQNVVGYYDRGLTEKNLKDTAQLFVPANNWYPLATMMNELISTVDIPEK